MRWVSLPLSVIAVSLVGCSVGEGSGSAAGAVLYTDCNLNAPNYSLNPSFFAANFIEDQSGCAQNTCPDAPGEDRLSSRHVRRRVNIRIQRGSFAETDSDGIYFSIADINMIRESLLGQPIPVSGDTGALVRATLYLNQTCSAGFPQSFWQVPAIMAAVSGTITFESVYAPDIDSENDEFVATFSDVRFEREALPASRNATLSGNFRFVYQRGGPAQRI